MNLYHDKIFISLHLWWVPDVTLHHPFSPQRDAARGPWRLRLPPLDVKADCSAIVPRSLEVLVALPPAAANELSKELAKG